MGFRAAGKEEVVRVSEQKEAEHLGHWHYTEQSAKSAPLTVESWDFRELTNFLKFSASGNSWVQSAHQQLWTGLFRYGRATSDCACSIMTSYFWVLPDCDLSSTSTRLEALWECLRASVAGFAGCWPSVTSLNITADDVVRARWGALSAQDRSRWCLVCPPSRPPCRCGHTASWLESSPLGSRGGWGRGPRGVSGSRMLWFPRTLAGGQWSVSASHIFCHLLLDALMKHVVASGGCVALTRVRVTAFQVQGSPVAWGKWGGWLSKNQTRSPVSWLVLIRGTQAPPRC